MNESYGKRGTAKEEILEPRFFVGFSLNDGYIRRGTAPPLRDLRIRVDVISWVIVEGRFGRYVQNMSVTKFGFESFPRSRWRKHSEIVEASSSVLFKYANMVKR